MKSAVLVAGLIAGMIAISILTAGPDPAGVPTSDEVAARTMSPFCEGLTLNECPHSKSAALRAEIDAMVRAGATNREIDEWMERNYGIVSQGRPGSGFAWLAPPVLAGLGLIGLFAMLRKRTPHRPEAEAPVPQLDAAEEARFAADFGTYVKGTE